MNIQDELLENGYVIIPNVLTDHEIEYSTCLFHEWQKTIPNYNEIHRKIDPHGIHKFHEIGHQRHAWYIRTLQAVQDPFKQLWNTDDLIVSYDGTCYIPQNTKSKDTCWTHTDQAPNKTGLHCYQGFVSLTSNENSTLVVYEGTHELHEQYFKDKDDTSNKDWNKIDPAYLEEIKDRKRVLSVPAGSLVIWDSRTFHQNQYGTPKAEERIVQYVSYLPRKHKKNTPSIHAKRIKYYNERRTTSHWACPVKVNGKQPQHYGNKDLLINYDELTPPDLCDLEEEINKLI